MEVVHDVSYTNCTENHLHAHSHAHPALENQQGVDLRSQIYKCLVCHCVQSLLGVLCDRKRNMRSTGTLSTNSFSNQPALSSDG